MNCADCNHSKHVTYNVGRSRESYRLCYVKGDGQVKRCGDTTSCLLWESRPSEEMGSAALHPTTGQVQRRMG